MAAKLLNNQWCSMSDFVVVVLNINKLKQQQQQQKRYIFKQFYVI